MIGIKANTICDLIVTVGENCQRFLRNSVKNVAAEQIELDEIWDFVGMKRRTKASKGYISEDGDAWTWLAIDGKSKLVLSHAVGSRDESTYDRFMRQLNGATVALAKLLAMACKFTARCHYILARVARLPN